MFGEWRSLNWPEISILSILIFVVLTVLRGTRGEAMLKTLAALLAMTYIVVRGLATSEIFDGSRLTFVLDNILAASSIALVVIFQPELRRLLALKIGARFFAPPSRDRAVLEEVIRACFELKKSKTGALVVLERANSLSEYYETGTYMDAEVTAPLLQSLFFVSKETGKGTPLHDGAVIISGGRLAAASCFLPPTTEDHPAMSRGDKRLGARHRAALGLSEHQDALVVVVSEETGAVSIAVGGDLEYDLDREALGLRLDELYLQAEDAPALEDEIEDLGLTGEQPEPTRAPKSSTTRAVRR